MAESFRFSLSARRGGLVAVLLLGVLVATALAEGFVRLRQWAKYGTATSYESLYKTDEASGLQTLVPGARVGKITINASGFRGPEIEMPKPPGRIRLAFIGASTTFCAEVSSDAAAWPNLVVETLRARFPATQFDYVNGAVPGYAVPESIVNLQRRIDPLGPDVVIIYHATNDLSGEVNRLAADQGLAVADIGPPGFLSRHLLLWELVTKNLRVLGAQKDGDLGKDRVLLDEARFGAGFERDLRELVDLSQRGDRLVAMATFSTQLRAEQSTESRKRAAISALVYMPSIGLDSLLFGYGRYNDIIRAVARERGALLIDGENAIPGDPVNFIDAVHFTDAGSRRMADRVSDALAGAPAFERLVVSRRIR